VVSAGGTYRKVKKKKRRRAHSLIYKYCYSGIKKQRARNVKEKETRTGAHRKYRKKVRVGRAKAPLKKRKAKHYVEGKTTTPTNKKKNGKLQAELRWPKWGDKKKTYMYTRGSPSIVEKKKR
jgi:hypothetical protein